MAVKSIDWSAAAATTCPPRTVVFEFGELFLAYYQQLTTGALAGPKTGAWSKINNSTKPGLVNAGDTSNG